MRGRVLVVAVMVAGCGFSINGTEPGHDARPDMALTADSTIDAPPFICPPAYRTLGTGRYLVLTQTTGFLTHHANCLTHSGTGITHLAVIDDGQEAIDLLAAIDALAANDGSINSDARFFVGAVQAPNQSNPGDGWIDFEDRNIPATLWTTDDNEPNDGGDDNENNHQEQVAALRRGTVGLVDIDTGQNVRSVCECDGIPVTPKALEFLQQLP